MPQLINFNHVSRALRFYRNDTGAVRPNRPEFETCCNDPIPQEFLDKYKSKNYVDRWKLVVKFYFAMHDKIEFVGQQAESYWTAYAAYLMNRKTKKARI